MVGTFTVGGNVSGNVVVPSKISPEQARGYLKQMGVTNDPDILALHRSSLLEESKQKRLYAWVMIGVGVILIPTIIGLAVTIVTVPMGMWGLSRIKNNERVVDAAIADLSAQGTAPA